MLALQGTLSLKNYDPTFSEVVWLLVYWVRECPVRDITLSKLLAVCGSTVLRTLRSRIPSSL